MRMQAHQSWEFKVSIDVRCPRCGGDALVRLMSGERDWHSVMFGARRLSCTMCGCSRNQPARARSNPSMGCELRFKAVTRWGELVFFNREHLAYIAEYIAAPDRHIRYAGQGPRNNTIFSRLPHWAKLAGHREELLAAIRRL